MDYDFRENINETKNQNNIFIEKIFPLNNEIIKDNYFNSTSKKISVPKMETMNNIYHSIKFKGRINQKEEIKNPDSYYEYEEKNNHNLFFINSNLKNNSRMNFIINHSPKNLHYNKSHLSNQYFQQTNSPIQTNLFNNNFFNSERKTKNNNYFEFTNKVLNKSKNFNDLNKHINITDNNIFPNIPCIDTCIENFENLIIKKNNINIIPIPKKIKALNNNIRKNLFNENRYQNKNFENSFNKYYSPQKKIFKNIDINLDSNNEKTICSNINVSQEFKNKSNVKLKLSPKPIRNFCNGKTEIKSLIKRNIEDINIKLDFSRQLNIRIKKLKNISNSDFKILWSGKSKAGRDKNRNIKINQDSFKIIENINNIKNFNIYVLCDGHGKDGHYVSKYITQNISSNISFHPSISHSVNSEEIYQSIIKNDYQLIKDIFSNLDLNLSFQKNFDTIKSGSTCILIIQIGSKIICANVGDSRAILVYSNSPNLSKTKIFPLSLDSKPNLPSELKRIINCGGEVHQRINNKGEYVGPMRVYAKGKNFPGLAMSRSFGDFQCKKYGVINEPSFVEYNLDENCKYLVIGSDGVWDFLDNEIVVKIGNKYYLKNNPEGFCKEILENAAYWWEKEDSVIDDITALVIFFNFFV